MPTMRSSLATNRTPAEPSSRSPERAADVRAGVTSREQVVELGVVVQRWVKQGREGVVAARKQCVARAGQRGGRRDGGPSEHPLGQVLGRDQVEDQLCLDPPAGVDQALCVVRLRQAPPALQRAGPVTPRRSTRRTLVLVTVHSRQPLDHLQLVKVSTCANRSPLRSASATARRAS